MIDITIFNQDLQISSIDTEEDEPLYDLVLSQPLPTEDLLLKRVLQTPYGYITLWGLDEEGIDYLDDEYGNQLYSILGEPLTPSWINDSNNYLKKALSFIEDVVSISFVEMYQSTIDSISFRITYTSVKGNTETINTSFSI
ncbi:hypothetical protein H6G33_09280 [Calothrix sp. FACHB-1219]|uniref:hypothetical protein n=1 Tax=unclassified Calothrix TaxID=2619626 RepID=UPI001684ED57|nr:MULTISPECIES: hypothetical protein [unclassified Calothrix]MBD2201537.1 hypothetical protein [Calothrix sp. FACHB-168]MBD2217223.1 hypothetical protein [Calothrix sp. FACHB-1219]